MINVTAKTAGIVSTNCYLAFDSESLDAVVIDPGDMAFEVVKKAVEELGLSVKAVLITHGHFDHIGEAEAVSRYFSVKIYAGEHEKEIMSNPKLNGSMLVRTDYKADADMLLKNNEELNICGMRFVILHTPGHTKGGICFYMPDEKLLFSGDTLFYESIGRSDLPTGDGAVLLQSINSLLKLLPDETKVYPGHGKETTIGHERRSNPYIGR